MGYELEFLPVGEAGDSGDAITLRYGNLLGRRSEQRVIVIDGGFADTAESVESHIRDYYSTDTIDIVISTHPDADHINGLPHLLESFTVHELWMHRPSRRKSTLDRIAKSIQEAERRKNFRKSIDAAKKLEQLARNADVRIREPFAGVSIDNGALQVVGPTEDDYQMFLEDASEDSEQRTLIGQATRIAKETVKRVAEEWGVETLTDEGGTSPINNTSVITTLSLSDRKILLTSDAGIPALEAAVSFMQSSGRVPGGYYLVQVPHHGSRRNVGPTILNQLLGPVTSDGSTRGNAVVSVAPEGEPKHPAKKVTNAFLRRGYPVYPTQGNTIRSRADAPSRSGWGPVDPLPFYEVVEE